MTSCGSKLTARVSVGCHLNEYLEEFSVGTDLMKNHVASRRQRALFVDELQCCED